MEKKLLIVSTASFIIGSGLLGAEPKAQMAKFTPVSIEEYFSSEKKSGEQYGLSFDWDKTTLNFQEFDYFTDSFKRLMQPKSIKLSALFTNGYFNNTFHDKLGNKDNVVGYVFSLDNKRTYNDLAFKPLIDPTWGSLVVINQYQPKFGPGMILGLIVKVNDTSASIQTGPDSIIANVPFEYIYQSIPLLSVSKEELKPKNLGK